MIYETNVKALYHLENSYDLVCSLFSDLCLCFSHLLGEIIKSVASVPQRFLSMHPFVSSCEGSQIIVQLELFIILIMYILWFSSVQSLSHVQLFVTPWTAARQASLSITNSRSLLKLMSIESVMPSNHLILCCPLLPLPSILPSIRVFSSKSVLHIRWPKY